MGEALKRFGEVWLQGLRLTPIDVSLIAQEFEIQSTQAEIDELAEDIESVLQGNAALEALRISGVVAPESEDQARTILEAIHSVVGVCRGRDITEILRIAAARQDAYACAFTEEGEILVSEPLQRILSAYGNGLERDDEDWIWDGSLAIHIRVPVALLSKEREYFMPQMVVEGVSVIIFREWSMPEFSVEPDRLRECLPNWNWEAFGRGRRYATDCRCFSAEDLVYSTL